MSALSSAYPLSARPVPPPTGPAPELVTPGTRLQKRDGSFAPFDGERIRAAIEKAFRADLNLTVDAPTPAEIAASITLMANAVVQWCATEGETREIPLHVEQVQDQVERVLMAGGEHRVAPLRSVPRTAC